MEEATGDNAHALGTLLNDCYQYQESRDLPEVICGFANPIKVAKRLNCIDESSAASWGHFCNRVASLAPRKWKISFTKSISTSALTKAALAIPSTNSWPLGSFIVGINWLDGKLGLGLLKATVPAVIAALNRSPIETVSAFREVFWWVLGFGPFLQRKPSPEQIKIARRIVRGIGEKDFAASLSAARRRDWEELAGFLRLISQIAPASARRIGTQVNTAVLDAANPDMWKIPSRELIGLVWALGYSKGAQGRKWVEQHASDLQVVTFDIAIIAPKVAIQKMSEGYALTLRTGGAIEWGRAAAAVYQISRFDKAIAATVLSANCTDVAEALSNLQSFELPNLRLFLEGIRTIAPTEFTHVFKLVDRTKAAETWPARWQETFQKHYQSPGATEARDSLTRLFRFAKGSDSAMKRMVQQIEKQLAKDAPTARRKSARRAT